MNLEDAQRAEAEALDLLGMKTNRVLRTGNEEGWNRYLVDYADAVRRTERVRVEALVAAAHQTHAKGLTVACCAALAAYRESQP